MIDFACKQFRIEDVIKCGLGLTKADCKVIQFLLRNNTEWFTSEQISKELDFNITTVQRSLKRLTEKDITIRNQNNLENGGYIFIYQAKGKNDIRELIMNVIKEWTKKVQRELEEWQR
ncbi:HTH domain-containing protein [Candidatus Woesearchaeota archaeon]|nr:HTH domain-containing protein [Candidatus Woesearchaeota archaeon]